MIRAVIFAMVLLPSVAMAQAPQCSDYWSFTEPECSDVAHQDRVADD